MRPELGILLPVRNAGPHLGGALASLSAQTLGDWTCWALDDASQDGSGERLRQHASLDPRFRVLTNIASTGVAAALQRLLETADTRWVARMDADDVCLPQRLERQWQAAQAAPAVALWGTGVEPLGEPGPGWRHYLNWLNGVHGDARIRAEAFTESPLPHPTWLARRAALVAAGGYRSGPFLEDYDLFLRLLRRGESFGKVAEPLLRWRDHPGRETRTSPRAGRDAVLRLKAHHFARGWQAGALPHLPRRELAIWGAGQTGRLLHRELAGHGLPVAAFVDPLKAGRSCAGAPVLDPAQSPPGRHLLLVAVGPRPLREQLEQRFAEEGRVLARDYLWLF